MFASNKALPAPPAPPKPRNASLAAKLPTYRSRPTPSGATHSNPFNVARALFDAAQKPAVQKAVVSASQNPTVRSAAISAAKNEQIQSVALGKARDENARHTIAEMARMYDSEVAKNASGFHSYVNSSTVTTSPKKCLLDKSKSLNSTSQSNQWLYDHEKSLLYPNLSSETSNLDNNFTKLSKSDVINPSARLSSRPPSSNFEAIHNELSSLNLYSTSTKKQPPPRPPPPKLNRCSQAPSSSPANEPHAIVRYPYNSVHVDELTCMPNDIVILKKEVDEQWIYALNTRTGESGIVPIVFLDIKVPLVPTQKMDCVSKAASRYKSQGASVRAIYDYRSDVLGDLQFQAGDSILVTGRVNDEWLRGVRGMHEGIFPINFVKVTSGTLPPSPRMDEGKRNKYIFQDQQESTLPDFNFVRPTSSPQKVETVIATYDYNSGVPEDLVFAAGDIIEVLEWVNNEWIRGCLRGSTGLVPYTYVSQPKSTP